MIQTIFRFGMIAAFGMGLASCGIEEERKVVLPQSEESEIPWNRMLDGEGQGQFGAFQNR